MKWKKVLTNFLNLTYKVGKNLQSNSAGPTPTIMIDTGSFAALRKEKLLFNNQRGLGRRYVFLEDGGRCAKGNLA